MVISQRVFADRREIQVRERPRCLGNSPTGSPRSLLVRLAFEEEGVKETGSALFSRNFPWNRRESRSSSRHFPRAIAL